MVAMPKQVGLIADIADLAAGGAITLTAATTSEQYRALSIAQTTAGQAVTIPDPTDTSVKMAIDIHNTGSAAFTMYGRTVDPNTFARFAWDGTQWTRAVDDAGSFDITETLTPSAQNTVPNLANGVAAGSTPKVYINCVRAVVGVAVSAAGAITITPALLTYNVETSDTVTVDYTPA